MYSYEQFGLTPDRPGVVGSATAQPVGSLLPGERDPQPGGSGAVRATEANRTTTVTPVRLDLAGSTGATPFGPDSSRSTTSPTTPGLGNRPGLVERRVGYCLAGRRVHQQHAAWYWPSSCLPRSTCCSSSVTPRLATGSRGTGSAIGGRRERRSRGDPVDMDDLLGGVVFYKSAITLKR